MTYTLTIPGRLPGVNEYTAAQRTGWYMGAKMKRDAQKAIGWCIKQQLRGVHIQLPVFINYTFYDEPHRGKHRDRDNISGQAHKFINDALVEQKVLTDDGWENILGSTDRFFSERQNPRIVVEITEVLDERYIRENK